MRIEIGKIEMHSFMPYGDETFDFAGTKGMNLICGKNLDLRGSKNGTGKTSIALGLTYGLFGTLPFKLKNENIVNRYASDRNMRICLYLKSDGVEYKIARGLNRGKSSYCNLYRIEEGEEIDITKSSIAETNLYIEKEVVRCDLDMFMRTIYLNSDPSYNFYNLKHAEKKEFIDKIFDISIFGNMYDCIHRDVVRLDKEIVAHQNKLMVLNSTKEDLDERSRSFEEEKASNIKSLEAELGSKRKAFEKESAKTERKNDALVEKCRAAMERLSESILKTREKIVSEESETSALLREEKNLKSMIDDRKKIIDRHGEVLAMLCDDCKKVFSDYHGLGKYEREIASLSKKACLIPDKVSANRDSVKVLKEKTSENEGKLRALKDRMSTIEMERDADMRRIRGMEMAVKSLEQSVEREKSSTNPYLEMIDENRKSVESETSALSDGQERYRYLKTAESIVDQENLKKFIIKDLVILLNNRIKFYLHRLGANFDVEFDDEMNYDFKTSSPATPEFNNFSSGEQARISIATCFAFRDFLSTRSSISSNVLILDEFIDSNVDSQAIDNTIQLLKEMSEQNGQNIFLVSHRKEIDNSVFDNIIQVEKKDNISRIRNLSA